MTLPKTTEDYRVTRLNFRLADFDDFQRRYEEAVPPLPSETVAAMVAHQAPWSEMLDYIASVAPYDFLIYHRMDVAPVMRLAGDRARCVTYRMGNHTIAEQMFRHDPRAMLYAPLHTMLWEDENDGAWFTVDRPSSQFSSLGDPRITAVGQDLDRKLAALLFSLGIDTPDLQS